MRTSSTSLGLSLLFAACLAGGVPLSLPSSHAAEIPNKVKGAARVDAEIRSAGQTRVIVHVATGIDDKVIDRRLRNKDERGGAIRELRSRIEPVMLSYFPARRGGSGRIVKSIDTIGAFAADVTAAELARMKADPRILRIEIDELKRTNLNASLPLIGQTTVFDNQPNGTQSDGSNARAVAVIDTGVQAAHPFIGQVRVVAEACYLTDVRCPGGQFDQTGPGASAPSPGESHGTHVAGIAIGRYQSGSPVNRGVASKSDLVMVNVFGSQGGAYTSDIIQGLEYVHGLVVNNGNPLRIAAVNMSLGGGSSSGDCDTSAEKNVIDRLRAAGVITVVAAGNDSSRTQMSSPGCISSAFSVAATSKSGVISSYSNISRTTDVFAPGGDFSTNGCITSSVMGGQYDAYCGTSMAAPHVAGAVALLRAAKPAATAAEIEMALTSSGAMVMDTRSSGTYGAPMINIPNALAALANLQMVSLTAQVTGGGTVSSQPTGLSCGTACTASFMQGQSVTLTATPSQTSVLSNWGGDASQCGAAATCTITMNQSASIQANFAAASWIRPMATALDSNLAWTTPAGADSAPWYGQNKTLRSGDATGYAVSGDIGDGQASGLETVVTGPGTLSFYWSVSSEASFDYLEFWINGVKQSGPISGSAGWAQRSFSLQSGTQTLRWVYRKDTSVSTGSDAGFLDAVSFTPTASPSTYSLKLSKSGTRYGSVSSSPAGINCGTSCSSQTASFNAGQQVTLTAAAVSRRRFTGWSGACTGTQLTCVVTLNSNKSVSASFR